MARRDWKRAIGELLDGLGDRLRDLLGAVDELLSPPPEPVPIPVRPGPRDPRR